MLQAQASLLSTTYYIGYHIEGGTIEYSGRLGQAKVFGSINIITDYISGVRTVICTNNIPFANSRVHTQNFKLVLQSQDAPDLCWGGMLSALDLLLSAANWKKVLTILERPQSDGSGTDGMPLVGELLKKGLTNCTFTTDPALDLSAEMVN